MAVVVVLALLAAGAWLLIIKPHRDMVAQDASGRPSAPAASSSTAAKAAVAAPPANVAAMDVNQLLSEARRAMNEQRYLAPASNNAFEFYLGALQKQPGNSVAVDALRETFPFAANSAESAINARDFNEAQRQIDLLAKADPANYTLTILRSKLDAQRKLLDKEQQQALDQQHQQQLAAQRSAEEKAAAERLAEQQRSSAAAAQQAEAQRTEQARLAQQRQQQQAQQAAAAVVASNTQGASSNTDAILIRMVQPRYPTQARRANQEGWVDVQYTVDAEGNVSNAHVVASQPRHIFEREATDAVERWKFKPATRDGTPVASTRQQRIQFQLNAQ
ncbi:energy transducer TonB [Frateuria defendens]|uniref:energy transducer TonB n=1 Tax=Frateuria defendens TaxID=2219559 RepID=UPI0030199379